MWAVTLMNQLIGERLSIINAKAQTTRHRIMGIVSGDDWQIVYSDTPGVLDPAYKLQEGMMKFVKTALRDADVLLIVTTPEEDTLAHPETLEKVQKMDIPVLLLINKVDLSDQSASPNASPIGRTSLQSGDPPHQRLARVQPGPPARTHCRALPESAFFPKDEMTDKPMRFFIGDRAGENPHPLQARGRTAVR